MRVAMNATVSAWKPTLWAAEQSAVTAMYAKIISGVTQQVSHHGLLYSLPCRFRPEELVNLYLLLLVLLVVLKAERARHNKWAMPSLASQAPQHFHMFCRRYATEAGFCPPGMSQ